MWPKVSNQVQCVLVHHFGSRQQANSRVGPGCEEKMFHEPCYKTHKIDNGYPQDGLADKNPYPLDRRADKDSCPHSSNNQCIILKLQLSCAMINVQLMLV